jgi:hypothetical protein
MMASVICKLRKNGQQENSGGHGLKPDCEIHRGRMSFEGRACVMEKPIESEGGIET